MKTIRIGSGAGYSGDRIEPAVELAEKGAIAYLVFECLAERTIAIAQQAKRSDPAAGYDPLLAARMEACLPVCRRNGVRVVTNMGAANPRSAAAKIREIAERLGLRGLRVAAVTGDDVLEAVRRDDPVILETGARLSGLGDRIVSANAYLGAGPIVEALRGGADVVVTGRVADPSLFLAPLMVEFGWREDQWDLLGRGTVLGHLLECAGQVTGGYFADPGFKDVPGLARLGFPIAEVAEDGSFAVTKVPGSGGVVTPATCKEQLLYEIHDPSAYITPDVVADFTSVRLTDLGEDRVQVTGGRGRPRTESLKVSIGYVDSWVGEGQISYGGPGAVARGRLALEIVRERLRLTRVPYEEIRCELIGLNALHGEEISRGHEPYEVRLRVAARTRSREEALRIGNEVETLYTNGPAGGAGAWKAAREVVAIVSTLIPRNRVQPRIHYEVT
ncbi:MAG: acyclic terpene utilization AtuA family protein [Desulfobacterales bacterium]